MRREFRRFFADRIIVAFGYLIFIMFIILVVRMSKQNMPTNDISGYLGDYDSKEELIDLYEDLKNSVDINKKDYLELGLDMSPIYDRLSVFEYMIMNYHNSQDAVLYSNSYPNESNDAFTVMLTINNYILLLMLLSFAFLSIYFISTDFSNKRHLFLYAGKNRINYLKEKVFSYFLVSVVLYVLFQLLNLLITSVYAIPVKTVIMIVNGKVYGISFIKMWILDSLGIALQLYPYHIAFLVISVLTKNDIIAGISDAAFFFGIRFLCQGSEGHSIIKLFGTSPIYTIAFGDGTFFEWLSAFAIMLVVLVIVCFVSIVMFKKRDFA